VTLLAHNAEEQLFAKAKAFLALSKRSFISTDKLSTPLTERPKIRLWESLSPRFHPKGEDVERDAVAAGEAFEKRWRTLAPVQ
jgi:hypothetical protein